MRATGDEEHRRVRGVVALVVLVLVAGIAGRGATAHAIVVDGRLSSSLQTVSESPAARAYFEWGDIPAQLQLAGVSAADPFRHYSQESPWFDTVGLGETPLYSIASGLESLPLQLNPVAASVAVTIGGPRSFAVRLDGPGIDGFAVAAVMRRLGAKQHGSVLTAPPKLTGLTGTLLDAYGLADDVSAGDDTLAMGKQRASVTALLGGGATLGDEPAYRAAANCLGDVFWAVIAPPRALGIEAGPELIAIGGRRPAAATSPRVNVACAIDRGSALADRDANALRRALGPSGFLPHRGLSTSTIVAGSSVGRADSSGLNVVRAVLTLRQDVPAAFLFDSWSNADLEWLLATNCPKSPPGITSTELRTLCSRLHLPGGP